MNTKANKVFARIGFADRVVPIEEVQNNAITLTEDAPYLEAYLIGYEDEEGRECLEDGTYLDNLKQNNADDKGNEKSTT
jgi:hypothetical protein